MKRNTFLTIALITGVLLLFSTKGFCIIDAEFEIARSDQMVEMVDESVEIIGKKGEEAFVEFRVVGSKWNKGDPDLFVVDTEGLFLVHPNPEFIGKNAIDMKDVDGKPFVKDIIDKAKSNENRGHWHTHLWHKFKDAFVLNHTYAKIAKAPSGKKYIAGAVARNLQVEKNFVVDLVNAAIKLIKEKGPEAFPVFNDKNSEFRFKNTYVFVLDGNGVSLVEPEAPEYVGKNMLNASPEIADAYRAILKVANSEKGYGWAKYTWVKPEEGKPARKAAYVKKIEAKGKTYIVGSGVYLD